MLSCSRFVALLAVSSLLSSCASLFPEPAFKWADDEHYWRIDGEHDVVEWIEIEHGIADPTDDLAPQLRAVLEGRLVFPPSGGFPSLSFDYVAANVDASEDDPIFARITAADHGVKVVDAHLVLDTEGRVSLWRRTRIDHASAWLDAFQRELSRGGDPPELALIDQRTGLALDEASSRLQASALGAGVQIWKLDGNALLLELPMTAENAQASIDAWAIEPVDPGVRPPAEISFTEPWLRVRYVPDDTGWIGARPYEISADYSPRVLERLKQSGLSVEPASVYAKLRADAGLR